MGQDLRVIIGVPSGQQWERRFALSLIDMIVYCHNRPPAGASSLEVSICNSVGSILPQSRTRIVKQALARESTHVLFIDSDQTFPPDTLHRLLAWGLPVVGCNVATKNFPSAPTARNKSDKVPSGDLVYTRRGQSGIEKVWRVGTGVLLLETWIFKRLEQPWFQVRWNPAHEDFDGEDWCFVEKLEELGLHARIDHGLSWEIGHVGSMEYTHELCLAGELHEEVFGAKEEGSEKAAEEAVLVRD